MSFADLRPRSYLYVPGSAPEVIDKAFSSAADVVVIDLEDAVAPDQKDAAREAAAEALGEQAGAAPMRHVRINSGPEGFDLADLDAVVRPGLDGLRLPKAEDPAALRTVAATLDRLEVERGLVPGSVGLYPLIESARGACELPALLSSTPRVVRAALGAADLLADLGATGEDDTVLSYVRSQLVVISRAVGVGAPVETVFTVLHDEEGLRRHASRARHLGFSGVSVLHPRQLDVIHAAFAPSETELEQARAVLDAWTSATANGVGTAVVAGVFVDAAVAARARGLLESASSA